jgi:hypothetical protein
MHFHKSGLARDASIAGDFHQLKPLLTKGWLGYDYEHGFHLHARLLAGLSPGGLQFFFLLMCLIV